MAPKISLVLLASLLLVAAVGQVRGDVLPLPVVPGAITSVPVSISGIVPCSNGSNINVTAVPPFANAAVQVVCSGTVVATATTNTTGAFTINLGPISSLPAAVVTPLLSGQCRVAVATPLVACSLSLVGVTATLTAPLQLLNSTTGGVGIPTTITTIFGWVVNITNGVVRLFPGLFSSV
ncbi:hypothetical protein C2845_PM01G14610 [Panicum miliaceum]|uniref:Phylloplanin-like n=1 Tax=Panicum miliaceum TaxID=4540 RepID=A0A3L6TPE5_PANMI|nr:hypothetical protein C2845_PM01G14610 [Panicum miliaceum]